MKRKNGYYWIKKNNGWYIAYYDGEYWQRIGNDRDFTDFDFDEIDEKQIKR